MWDMNYNSISDDSCSFFLSVKKKMEHCANKFPMKRFMVKKLIKEKLEDCSPWHSL